MGANVEKTGSEAVKAAKELGKIVHSLPKSKEAKKAFVEKTKSDVGKLKKAQSMLDDLAEMAKKTLKEIDEFKQSQKKKATACHQAYQAAVAASGGLTSVKPSCVKKLQELALAADKETVNGAIEALTSHRDEVVKANANEAKGNNEVKSNLEAFVKGMNEAIKGVS